MAWDGRVKVWGEVVPLDQLPRKDLEALRAVRKEVSFPKGAVLMSEGEPGREAFLITEGTVSVKRGRKKIAELGPGNLVGEMALIVDEPRSATVTALEAVRAYSVPRSKFSQVLERPTVWWLVARFLAQRLRDENAIAVA
jgi:CRP-like cAMP-binding protein